MLTLQAINDLVASNDHAHCWPAFEFFQDVEPNGNFPFLIISKQRLKRCDERWQQQT